MKKPRIKKPYAPRPLPALVRCDFCGNPFHPPRWNSRTCHRCAAHGSPDQSLPGYWGRSGKLAAWQLAQGGLRAASRIAHACRKSRVPPHIVPD